MVEEQTLFLETWQNFNECKLITLYIICINVIGRKNIFTVNLDKCFCTLKISSDLFMLYYLHWIKRSLIPGVLVIQRFCFLFFVLITAYVWVKFYLLCHSLFIFSNMILHFIINVFCCKLNYFDLYFSSKNIFLRKHEREIVARNKGFIQRTRQFHAIPSARNYARCMGVFLNMFIHQHESVNTQIRLILFTGQDRSFVLFLKSSNREISL